MVEGNVDTDISLPKIDDEIIFRVIEDILFGLPTWLRTLSSAVHYRRLFSLCGTLTGAKTTLIPNVKLCKNGIKRQRSDHLFDFLFKSVVRVEDDVREAVRVELVFHAEKCLVPPCEMAIPCIVWNATRRIVDPPPTFENCGRDYRARWDHWQGKAPRLGLTRRMEMVEAGTRSR
jgi:hypothetical protein